VTGGKYKAAHGSAERAVAPPVPNGDTPHEDRGVTERELPKDEAPRGMDPAKWALMNRLQRREYKQNRRDLG
jgi:hypothetical protein